MKKEGPTVVNLSGVKFVRKTKIPSSKVHSMKGK